MAYKELKPPRNQTETLQMIFANPGMLMKGILYISLCGMLFMFLFASIAMFFFSIDERRFINKALETQALVINNVRKEYVDKRYDSSNTASMSVNYITVLTINFTDNKGQSITTKVSDGDISLFEKGDEVRILYDPKIPEKIILHKNKDSAQKLTTLSMVFGIATFILFIVVFTMSRRRKKVR